MMHDEKKEHFMFKRTRWLGISLLTVPLLSLAMPTGAPVNKIRFASQIDSWQALDARHLVLSLSASKNYLITLRKDCHSLPRAANVGVSASNDTIYAGFDYITADGQRCAIQTINKLSKAERNALNEV